MGKRGPKPGLHTPPIPERFWPKVEKTETCWLWTAGVSGNGYGQFWLSGRMRPAHVVAYNLVKGGIPSGLFLDHRHTCPKTCVNPDHLRPVTQKQNLENMAKSRSDSSTGIRGVTLHKERSAWRASACHNGRTHSAGYYKTPEEAGEAAKALRLKLFTHNDADRI